MDGDGGWTTIESDPGVFTELVEMIGVKGVEFEEVIDLDLFNAGDEIFGIVFLFDFHKVRAADPRTAMAHPPEGFFFAKQVVQNACATQAILSILLNLETDKVKIGEDLENFRGFASALDPESLGMAIGTHDLIRESHNSFHKVSSFEFIKDKQEKDDEAFHFVAYVPFKGSVYEIDGLKDGPILLQNNTGTYDASKPGDWLKVAKPAIQERMQKVGLDGKFNLMSVVPSKLEDLKKQVFKDFCLKQRLSVKLISLDAHVEDFGDADEIDEDTFPEGVPEFDDLPDSADELQKMLKECNDKIQAVCGEELAKRDAWKRENLRRKTDLTPFALCAMKHLAKAGKLLPLFETAQKDALAKAEAEKAKA